MRFIQGWYLGGDQKSKETSRTGYTKRKTPYSKKAISSGKRIFSGKKRNISPCIRPSLRRLHLRREPRAHEHYHKKGKHFYSNIFYPPTWAPGLGATQPRIARLNLISSSSWSSTFFIFLFGELIHLKHFLRGNTLTPGKNIKKKRFTNVNFCLSCLFH